MTVYESQASYNQLRNFESEHFQLLNMHLPNATSGNYTNTPNELCQMDDAINKEIVILILIIFFRSCQSLQRIITLPLNTKHKILQLQILEFIDDNYGMCLNPSQSLSTSGSIDQLGLKLHVTEPFSTCMKPPHEPIFNPYN